MAHVARRLGVAPQLKVVLCTNYRAPESVVHVYSRATYAGELRPTALCQRRLAPPGIAWPQLRSPPPGAPSRRTPPTASWSR